jgi:integrase
MSQINPLAELPINPESIMSVRKREWVTREGESKEAWIVDYIDQRGKRHIETFQRKKEADARHAHVRVDIGKGIHVAPSESITVAAAAKNWLDDVKARDAERSTLMQYRQHVNLHIVPRIGRVKLAKLTKAQVEQFRKSLLDEMSLALARKVFTSFRSILKQAGYSHVAVGVRIKPRKRDHRLEGGSDFPEPGEIKRLIAATKTPRQRALVLTAALTGLRASELRGLRWKDVDLKANELHVRKRADRFNAIGEPKTKSSIRAVPLSPELVAAFREWKVGCPNGSLDLGPVHK